MGNMAHYAPKCNRYPQKSDDVLLNLRRNVGSDELSYLTGTALPCYHPHSVNFNSTLHHTPPQGTCGRTPNVGRPLNVLILAEDEIAGKLAYQNYNLSSGVQQPGHSAGGQDLSIPGSFHSECVCSRIARTTFFSLSTTIDIFNLRSRSRTRTSVGSHGSYVLRNRQGEVLGNSRLTQCRNNNHLSGTPSEYASGLELEQNRTKKDLRARLRTNQNDRKTYGHEPRTNQNKLELSKDLRARLRTNQNDRKTYGHEPRTNQNKLELSKDLRARIRTGEFEKRITNDIRLLDSNKERSDKIVRVSTIGQTMNVIGLPNVVASHRPNRNRSRDTYLITHLVQNNKFPGEYTPGRSGWRRKDRWADTATELWNMPNPYYDLDMVVERIGLTVLSTSKNLSPSSVRGRMMKKSSFYPVPLPELMKAILCPSGILLRSSSYRVLPQPDNSTLDCSRVDLQGYISRKDIPVSKCIPVQEYPNDSLNIFSRTCLPDQIEHQSPYPSLKKIPLLTTRHKTCLFGILPSGDLLSGDLLSGDLLSGILLSGDLLSGDLLSGDLLSSIYLIYSLFSSIGIVMIYSKGMIYYKGSLLGVREEE